MIKLKQSLAAVVLVCLAILQGCGSDTDTAVEGLYTATTEDGLSLKMLRYRPSPEVPFLNSQPIVLFPSILSSMNVFNAFTPENRQWAYRGLTLPDDASSWAVNDQYIQDDAMKYYSLAHWLYQHGYDVWLAHYRGVGRGDFKSDEGNGLTNLDVWISLDAPAVVDKVIDVTGQHPVIGGHSTGGLVFYMYLQGVTMDASVVAAGEYNPHLTSSAALAEERNAKVAGFMSIDPAGVPPLAFEELLDNPLIWGFMTRPWYIDFDRIVGELVMPLLPVAVNNGVLGLVFNTITYVVEAFPEEDKPAYVAIFDALNFWELDNMNKYVEDFFAREVLSSLYIGILAQYSDWGINSVFREHWMNGEENKDTTTPPDAQPGSDGYYYYETNMSRMTVPALSFFSESSGLVDTETVVGILYDGKTPHPKDVWYEVAGSAHIDIPMGEDAPRFIFPTIIDWLDNL